MTRGKQLATEAIVQYLLLFCAEGPVDDDDRAEMEDDDARVELDQAPAEALAGQAAERHGILMVGGPRQAMEATLEFRGQNVMITDGPYARMHGQIRGFDVVDRAQLEEVIELASRPNSP
jgi:hypothetical protein